ncbi:MAG TPA: FMN-binding negative transcriptional regulator [Pirellulales bacterium]|nr:FMN-binding negative transcriptional regulator [Pirellulales bacterium]
MFTPPQFDEPRREVMHDLMRRYPLATLVTMSSAGGFVAKHLPLLRCQSPAPFGSLQGHVARANPVWTETQSEAESLVVFQGPSAYISPSWYATKQETGRVVPTWNYAVVHAYGRLRFVHDAAWVRSLVERLTVAHEAGFSEPWQVADAPADYIANQLRAIVGIEFVVTRLLGKWKMSQNQPAANRAGVANGLRSLGTTHAAEVGDLVRRPDAS